MTRTPLFLAAAAVALTIEALPTYAAQPSVLKDANLTMQQARQIALKSYPGKIMKEELEHEGGGSGLRYSFDIRQGRRWREIGVDAKTGKILEDKAESANPKD